MNLTMAIQILAVITISLWIVKLVFQILLLRAIKGLSLEEKRDLIEYVRLQRISKLFGMLADGYK